MRAKLYLTEMAIAAGLGAAVGLFFGFIGVSGILELIFDSRQGSLTRSRRPSAGSRSDLIAHLIYGALAGAIFGAIYGFINAREVLAKREKSSSSET